MDIVQHIHRHTEDLQTGFVKLSAEQQKFLKLLALEFYFQLPEALAVIEAYMHTPIDKDKLLDDIRNGTTCWYKEIMVKRTEELDEYADDYEELEQIPIYILNAFDHAIDDNNTTEGVVQLFLDMINTLDYYENFSEEPEYWNQLLEKEVVFQREMLAALASGGRIDPLIYQKRYADVEFDTLV
ncbi:hypothetical protein SAMN05660841_02631 [Sphingobacterium nematocida]|uniref:Uncharacterized protein n=2 Tax=Sphingobacterium nematocida TaxID=1513896 RepID=A0A1T5EJV0_9SPHI|nr:hypothetical protein SAMN05660841_02631 [Sphingobacterium nematocida]